MAGDRVTELNESYMRQCIEIGRRAARAGEAPVSAIVVRDDRVVAEAGEEVKATLDVTAHAEVVAIRRASRAIGALDLSGCTLYTNVEPCVLCSYAIRRVSIERVVIGAPTGALGGVSSHHPILAEPGLRGFGAPPSIVQGVLLDECTALAEQKPGDTA